MLYALSLFGLFVCLLHVLWGLYALVMHLKHTRDDGKLTKVQFILAWPYLLLGLLVDFVANILVSFIFLDPPKHWTVSERLTVYINKRTDWRHTFALWIATNILDSLDPKGVHRVGGD